MRNPIALLLTLFAIPAAADNASPLVTVSGGTIAVDETNPETQTSFSKVVPREKFKTTTGSVADVLKQETGVQLRQRGGLGSSANVFLRGSDSQQVNVYLDGLLMNAAAGGGVDLSQFLLNSVEAVEVYPDVTPIQLGFPNLAGAINIKTRKSGEGASHVQAGGGSFSARNLGAHLTEVIGDHSGLFAAEYLAAENDYDMLNDNQTELYSTDDRIEKRKNADFNQINMLGKFEFDLAEEAGLQFMLLNNQKKQGLPNVKNSPDNNSSLNTDSIQIQTRFFSKRDDHRSWSARAYYAKTNERYDDRLGRTGLGANWSESETDSYGVNPSMAWAIGSHLITTSVEGKLERFDQKNLLRNEASPNWQRQGVSIGIQDEWQNSDGEWLIVPAASLSWINDKGNLSGLQQTQEYVDSNNSYSSVRIGAKYLFATSWAMKSNFGRHVRVPSLYELLGDRGYFVGQPDLQPERAIATDVGVEYCSVAMSGSIILFHRRVDDALVVGYDSRGVGRYSNVSQSETIGTELSFDYSLPLNVVASLRTTLQEARDHSNLSDRKGKLLPSVYRHASNLSLTHRFSNIENRLDFGLEEGGFYTYGEVDPIESKRLLDYSVRYQIEDVQLAFEAKNLLDKQFMDFNRFPAPGRSYFVKATKEF